MSILSDVGSVVTAPVRGVKDLAGNVWRALKWFITVVAGVFGHVGDAWHLFWTGIKAAGTAIGHVAETLYLSTRHIVTVLIPRWASKAYHDAVKWAKAAAAAVERALKALVTKTYHLLRGAILAVAKTARHAITAVIHTLNGALHWIRNAGVKVADLVLHPARLVAWILPDLIFPLLRFLLKGGVPILKWLAKGILSILPMIARELESAIADLF